VKLKIIAGVEIFTEHKLFTLRTQNVFDCMVMLSSIVVVCE